MRSYTHDWANDPFSRGACRYTPVEMVEMPSRLAELVASSMYFVEEAASGDGDQGTVHGA